MALPTGLLPVLAFVLTVGVAAPVTLAAHLRSRDGRRPFAAALVLAGIGALAVLVVGPLLVGRRLVRRARGVDAETGLRFVTYGWLLAMLAVFGIFVAPGGFGGSPLLPLDGERVCLAGFCGVALSLLGATLLELAVAVLGPGLVGSALHAVAERTRGPDTSWGS